MSKVTKLHQLLMVTWRRNVCSMIEFREDIRWSAAQSLPSSPSALQHLNSQVRFTEEWTVCAWCYELNGPLLWRQWISVTTATRSCYVCRVMRMRPERWKKVTCKHRLPSWRRSSASLMKAAKNTTMEHHHDIRASFRRKKSVLVCDFFQACW